MAVSVRCVVVSCLVLVLAIVASPCAAQNNTIRVQYSQSLRVTILDETAFMDSYLLENDGQCNSSCIALQALGVTVETQNSPQICAATPGATASVPMRIQSHPHAEAGPGNDFGRRQFKVARAFDRYNAYAKRAGRRLLQTPTQPSTTNTPTYASAMNTPTLGATTQVPNAQALIDVIHILNGTLAIVGQEASLLGQLSGAVASLANSVIATIVSLKQFIFQSTTSPILPLWSASSSEQHAVYHASFETRDAGISLALLQYQPGFGTIAQPRSQYVPPGSIL